MASLRVMGLALIVVGVLIFAYQGVTCRSRKKVLDTGSLEITRKETTTVPLPPLMGGIAFAGGVVLLMLAEKKK